VSCRFLARRLVRRAPTFFANFLTRIAFSEATPSNPACICLARPARTHLGRGRLGNQLANLVFLPKTNAANERLAQHLWAHRDELFTSLRHPGLDATILRAEPAIRFVFILRKVWGGNYTWANARAQSVLMSVWRTC
jgi:hypothetical protein